MSVLNLVLLTTVNSNSKPRVIKIEKNGRSVRLKMTAPITPMRLNLNKIREKEKESKTGWTCFSIKKETKRLKTNKIVNRINTFQLSSW